MGKRDETLHEGGGSLGQRYIMLFFLAVNIRQKALIVKPFSVYFKSISTINRGGGFVKTNVITGGCTVVASKRLRLWCTCQYYDASQGGGGLKNVKIA